MIYGLIYVVGRCYGYVRCQVPFNTYVYSTLPFYIVGEDKLFMLSDADALL